MTPALSYVLAGLCGFAVSAGLAWVAWTLVSRQAWPPSTDVPSAGPAHVSSVILRQEVLSTLSVFAVLLSRFHFVERLKKLLAEANLTWSVGRTCAMMLLAGGVSFNLLLHSDALPLAGAFVLAGGVASLPVAYIRYRREQRFRLVEEQLPEALDYLSRAIVAGHSLPMSMELLAEEVGPPLSAELRKTVDEYNLGMSLEDALAKLAVRLPNVDIRFFVSAVMTQSRTGGDLHELLENLAETIRERAALKGQVRALTAHGRLTALILTFLPFFLAAALMTVNPEYILSLVHHPVGKTLLFCAVIAQGVAFWVINRISDIRV